MPEGPSINGTLYLNVLKGNLPCFMKIEFTNPLKTGHKRSTCMWWNFHRNIVRKSAFLCRNISEQVRRQKNFLGGGKKIEPILTTKNFLKIEIWEV